MWYIQLFILYDRWYIKYETQTLDTLDSERQQVNIDLLSIIHMRFLEELN